MSTQLLYCPNCGAANEHSRSLCFACLKPLDMTLEMPLVHERYRLLKQLGTGGYGAVYQAQDIEHPNWPLAIKQINLRGLDTRQIIEATETFQRERTLLARLNHPQLPHLYATFEDAEHWYLVLDYFPGETLEAYLATRSQTATQVDQAWLEELLRCGLSLCNILHYLHTREPALIFRDLKPSNIIRGPVIPYALIDFGIARTIKPGQLKDTIPLGSPGYAAPEQYGRAQTDARADIYSLGAILHEMLSGTDPGEQPLHFEPLNYTDPTLQRLENLILRMVSLRADDRPASILEVTGELQAIQAVIQRPETRIWTPGPGQTPPWLLRPGMSAIGSGLRQPPVPSLPALPKNGRTRRGVLIGLVVTGALVGGGVLSQANLLSKLFGSRRALIGSSPNIILTPNAQKSNLVDSAFAHQMQLVQLAWAPDSTCFACLIRSQGAPDELSLWDKALHRMTDPIALPSPVGPQGLAWSPDSQTLAVAETSMITRFVVKSTTVHGNTLTESSEYMLTSQHSSDHFDSLAWSPDNRKLYHTVEQNVYCLDSSVQTDRLVYSGHASDADQLTEMTYLGLWLSPDGQSMASTSNLLIPSGNANDNQSDNPLRIWSVADGGDIATIPPLKNGFSWIQWSPDSQYLAYGNGIQGIFVYDLLHSKVVFQRQYIRTTLALVNSPLSAWSPDSQYLALARFQTINDDPTAEIVGVVMGNTLYTLSEYKYPLAFDWSRTGGLVVAYANEGSSSTNSLIIWYDSVTGQQQASIFFPTIVDRLQWSPDGQYLVVAASATFGGDMQFIIYGPDIDSFR